MFHVKHYHEKNLEKQKKVSMRSENLEKQTLKEKKNVSRETFYEKTGIFSCFFMSLQVELRYEV